MQDMPICVLECRENFRYSARDEIILLTFDNNIVEQARNLMHSIRQHNDRKISFACMVYQLSEENMEKLLSSDFGVKLYHCELTVGLDSKAWPVVIFFRLLSPWVLEPEIQRVLYLDSDILCSGDLTDLFELEVPAIAMGNVIPANVAPDADMPIRRKLPTQIYCNSGVLVMNLDYFRGHFTPSGIVTELLEMAGDLLYPDQDYLNLRFQGHITYVNSFKYNFWPVDWLTDRQMLQDTLKNCRLIHFASYPKPWNYMASIRMVSLYYRFTITPEMKRKMKRALFGSVLCIPVRQLRTVVRKIRSISRGRH